MKLDAGARLGRYEIVGSVDNLELPTSPAVASAKTMSLWWLCGPVTFGTLWYLPCRARNNTTANARDDFLIPFAVDTDAL